MAFDAQREDYQRLGLRFARTLTGSQAENLRAYALFGHRYATDRDSLPQTDADRAFRLVADATRLVDYELPVATNDEEAQTIDAHARRLLDEALALDERCFDARRMRFAADAPTIDASYRFLRDHEDEVWRRCGEASEREAHDAAPERAQLGAAIALFPSLRWTAMLADKALVCGRNREALHHAEKALERDPSDRAGVRLTAALAHASMEDETGLAKLVARVGRQGAHAADDAWTRLAQAYVAHARRDFAAARAQIADMVRTYPHAAIILARQPEMPDGVFARLATMPHSEDELVVAVSEGMVLLREGRDELGMGTFGSWVMHTALDMVAPEQAGEVRDLIELRERDRMP